MAAKTDTLENLLIDCILRGQSITLATRTLSWSVVPTFYVAITSTLPTDAAAGTEFTGGSYARQPVVSSLTAWSGTQGVGTTVASSGTDGTVENNNSIAFTNMPALTAVGFEIWDALTGGVRMFHAPLTGQPIAIVGGSTVTFAANALTVQEDN